MTGTKLQQQIEQVYHQYFSDFPIFSVDKGQVVGRFFKFELRSYCEPVYACDTDQLLGHHAHLQASGPHQPNIGSQRLFALARDSSALVTLDRMVRTLHLLNYLALDNSQALTLFLSVDTALLGAVKEKHGQFFEHLSRQLGGDIRKIVISLASDALGDVAQLRTAIGNYRQHNFGTAIRLDNDDQRLQIEDGNIDVDYLFLPADTEPHRVLRFPQSAEQYV